MIVESDPSVSPYPGVINGEWESLTSGHWW